MRARLVPMESSDLLNDFVIDDDNIDFSKRQDNVISITLHQVYKCLLS
jgi:hypothetical protein